MLVSVLALLIVPGLGMICISLPARVAQRSAARVLPGMTLEEVEEILGSPLSYAGAVTTQYSAGPLVLKRPVPLQVATWRGDGYVEVRFDADGRVTRVDFLPDYLHRGPFRELRTYWQRWFS
jgi:hypothetical protein